MTYNHHIFKKDSLEELFEVYLKPFKSKNARLIFQIFLDNLKFSRLTTYDIVLKLEKYNLNLEKKEVNAWLLSLNKAGLIEKSETRGKPTTIQYSDKYTYDMWKLTDIGLKVSNDLKLVMSENNQDYLPKIDKMSLIKLEELEDLYITTKLIIKLHESGGQMEFKSLRKDLIVSKEKLASYSWPDSSYSERPLFEIIKKPSSLRSKLIKIFQMVSEDDLIFNLTDEGKKIAEIIMLNK